MVKGWGGSGKFIILMDGRRNACFLLLLLFFFFRPGNEINNDIALGYYDSVKKA